MERWPLMDLFIDWIYTTRLSWFVNSFPWVWPTLESLHFCALTVLAGTVGLFDLRVLGLVKGITPSALHATLRWGVIAFIVSAITGVMFISGASEQYFYNDAFRLKVVFLAAPSSAKFIAAASLVFLVGVMLCGRMLTFFRPPFFH